MQNSRVWDLIPRGESKFSLSPTFVTRRKNAYPLFHLTLFPTYCKHKLLATGKQLHNAHNQRNKDLHEQFTILKKCRGKFECLLYEMLSLHPGKKPKQNTKSDSIMAKLFSTQLTLSTFCIVEFLITCNETFTRFFSNKKTHRNLRL